MPGYSVRYPGEAQAINMVNKTTIPTSPPFKSNLEDKTSQILSVIILLVVVIVTFAFENRIVGLEPGYDDSQPKHHGWVSANTLAIISKATPENYFVGYALASRDIKIGLTMNILIVILFF